MMFNWDSDTDHMSGAGGWIGTGMMIVWMILLLAATVAIVFWLIRSNRPNTHDQRSPREIIDARYAKGEIDADQRELMLRKLSGDS